jgi:hypothetical protein
MNNHDYVGRHLNIKPCASVTPHINNHVYVGRHLDIKPCVSVALHINNRDYVGRSLDIQLCVSVTSHINNHHYVGRSLDIKACVSVTPHIGNHDYMETKIEKGNYTFMKEYLPEIRENVNELGRIQKLNESQAKQILSLENIKDIPKMMNFWTGVPNYDTVFNRQELNICGIGKEI